MGGRARAILASLGLLVAACAPVSPGATSAPGSPDASSPDTVAAWRTNPLVDVRTAETFAIADLAGKLVVVETMAVWCTSCRIQQGEAAVALDLLDTDDLVFISVGVDPNERPEDLAGYADRNGFDWRFVVATPEVARSLADEFGPQILSPPATPVIVVAPDGAVVDQHFGIRTAEALVAAWDLLLPER